MLSHIPRARAPISRAPNREDMATVSKYMPVSATATQQGLQGKPKKNCCGTSRQTLRRASLRCCAMLTHTGQHGKDWYVGSPELTETFLAPLEEKSRQNNPTTMA